MSNLYYYGNFSTRLLDDVYSKLIENNFGCKEDIGINEGDLVYLPNEYNIFDSSLLSNNSFLLSKSLSWHTDNNANYIYFIVVSNGYYTIKTADNYELDGYKERSIRKGDIVAINSTNPHALDCIDEEGYFVCLFIGTDYLSKRKEAVRSIYYLLNEYYSS